MGRDSVVGIATRYGWTVQGSNPGGEEIFHTRPDRSWGPSSFLYNGYKVLQGIQWLGRGVDRPPPSSAEVKERDEKFTHAHHTSSISIPDTYPKANLLFICLY